MKRYEPIREFPDRSISYLLAEPENMAALLRFLHPELAARIEPGSLRSMETTFIARSFHKREEDVLYEATLGPGRKVRFLVLVAHQSEPDVLMEFRLAEAIVLLYGQQMRELEGHALPPTKRRLSRVVPIVLHTGAGPWSAWPLKDLFEAEPALGWVPDGPEPVVLSLDEKSEEQLLESGEAMPGLLTLFKAEFGSVTAFRETTAKLLNGIEPGRKRLEAAWFAYNFTIHRLPREAVDQVEETLANAIGKKELTPMTKTMADVWLEKGIEKGIVTGSRRILAQLISLKFPKQKRGLIEQRLADIEDEERLDDLAARVLEDISWRDFWEAPRKTRKKA